MTDGLQGVVVAGPVGRLEVPLLGGTTDQVLEPPAQLLGQAGHVVTEPPLAGQVQRRAHDGVVAGPLEEDGRGDERCARAQGHGHRSGRQGGLLPEEVDLDAVAVDVAVRQEADDVAGLDGAR